MGQTRPYWAVSGHLHSPATPPDVAHLQVLSAPTSPRTPCFTPERPMVRNQPRPFEGCSFAGTFIRRRVRPRYGRDPAFRPSSPSFATNGRRRRTRRGWRRSRLCGDAERRWVSIACRRTPGSRSQRERNRRPSRLVLAQGEQAPRPCFPREAGRSSAPIRCTSGEQCRSATRRAGRTCLCSQEAASAKSALLLGWFATLGSLSLALGGAGTRRSHPSSWFGGTRCSARSDWIARIGRRGVDCGHCCRSN